MGEAQQGGKNMGEARRPPAKTYRELIVWEKARRAVVPIYKATAGFPESERFNLISQIRKCAVSIPSNIAEGFGRRGAGEFGHFLLIARGSLFELETQLILAHDLGFLSERDHAWLSAIVDEVELLLERLLAKVQSSR
jgi:four helix bundle protein